MKKDIFNHFKDKREAFAEHHRMERQLRKERNTMLSDEKKELIEESNPSAIILVVVLVFVFGLLVIVSESKAGSSVPEMWIKTETEVK